MYSPSTASPASARRVDASGLGIARRIVYSICLLPIVPAVSIVGVQFFFQNPPLRGLDEFHVYQGISAALWVALVIIIWRKAVHWTLGRRWLTAIVGFIPFIQCLYGQPLWNIPTTDSGCITLDFAPEMLRVSQHEIGVAFWIWICVWIWWGWERLQMKRERNDQIAARVSPVAKRLVMSVAYIPCLFGMFFLTMVAWEDITGRSEPFREAFSTTAGLAMATWILIWRRIVLWQPPVVRRTLVIGVLTLVIPCAAQFAFLDYGLGNVWEVVLVVLPLIGWGLWMALTVMSWPLVAETGDEVSAVTPRCLNCGYLLKGLRSTRCPECGSEPTIDELWASTAGVV